MRYKSAGWVLYVPTIKDSSGMPFVVEGSLHGTREGARALLEDRKKSGDAHPGERIVSYETAHKRIPRTVRYAAECPHCGQHMSDPPD